MPEQDIDLLMDYSLREQLTGGVSPPSPGQSHHQFKCPDSIKLG